MIINNLSKIIDSKKLKITTISNKTGITRPTLTSLYYDNSKGITLDVLNKLCEALSVSPSDIFAFYPVDIDKIDIEIRPPVPENCEKIKDISFTGKITFKQKQFKNICFAGTLDYCETWENYDVTLAIDMERKQYLTMFPDHVMENIEKILFDELEIKLSEFVPNIELGSSCFFYSDEIEYPRK